MWALCCTEVITNNTDVVNVQEGEPLLPVSAEEASEVKLAKISERSEIIDREPEAKAKDKTEEKKEDPTSIGFDMAPLVRHRVTTRSRFTPTLTRKPTVGTKKIVSKAEPDATRLSAQSNRNSQKSEKSGSGRGSLISGKSNNRRGSAVSTHSTATALFLGGYMDVRRRARTSVISHHHGRITDDYELLESLGVGGFGEVFRAKRKEDDHPCAIKSVDVEKTDPEVFQIELDQARQLKHPNIVRLLAAYRDTSSFWLVMEIYKGGDLLGEILQYKFKRDEMGGFTVGIPDDRLARYAYQMFSGVAYLHYHKIVHRDIKPENYMRTSSDDTAQLVLIDLGVSANLKITPVLEEAIGTLTTMAPEVLSGEYDKQCDLWSIGITIYMTAVCMEPWGMGKVHMDEDEMQECLCDPEWNVSYDERRWSLKNPECLDLVKSLLQRDPKLRPTANQVLANNKWIDGKEHSEEGGCCCIA